MWKRATLYGLALLLVMSAAAYADLFTRGKLILSADRTTYIEWDGTDLNFVVGDTEVFASTDLDELDGITAGTVTASKAVVVDASKDIGDFGSLDATNFDAGLSGTAGTVDVFPSTASKGKIAITAADNAGDTTTTIVNGSMAAARTLTMDDPGGAADFAFTDYQKTIVPDAVSGAAATVLGGDQSLVVAAITNDADDWMVMPACVVGRHFRLWSVVAHEVRTPAASDQTINGVDSDGGAAEASIPATTLSVFDCVATDTWIMANWTELGAALTIVPDA